MRAAVSFILLALFGLALGSRPAPKAAAPVVKDQADADMDALDAADADIPETAPTPVTLSKPKEVKAKVASKPKVLTPKAPQPDKVDKSSALWKDGKELTTSDDDVLAEGDAIAKKKIQALHQRQIASVAKAKVMRVPDADVQAASTDKADAVEGTANLVQDLKALEAHKDEQAKKAVEEKKEVAEELAEDKANAEKKKSEAVSKKPVAPKRKVDLNKLMKLTSKAKGDALAPSAELQIEVAPDQAKAVPKKVTIAAKAFKNTDTKAILKNTADFHSKMATHVAGLHNTLHEAERDAHEKQQVVINKAKQEQKAIAAADKVVADAKALKYKQELEASAAKALEETKARKEAKDKVAAYRKEQYKRRTQSVAPAAPAAPAAPVAAQPAEKAAPVAKAAPNYNVEQKSSAQTLSVATAATFAMLSAML